MALNKIILISEWLLLSCLTSTGKEYKLIYTQPASKWEEALPIGNGRIGAMVYGDPINEEYQLNEETLWSGYPHEWNNSKAIAALPKIREAVNNGDYALASLLWKENAQGPYTARYLPSQSPSTIRWKDRKLHKKFRPQYCHINCRLYY